MTCEFSQIVMPLLRLRFVIAGAFVADEVIINHRP